jgi:di/tricarboxylate transporter
MTNNAAAALVFPIAYQFAVDEKMAFMPFAVCIAVGASAAFMTPVGYQTNMMVSGPGGYSWWDFLRFGGPLTILGGIVCVLVAANAYG